MLTKKQTKTVKIRKFVRKIIKEILFEGLISTVIIKDSIKLINGKINNFGIASLDNGGKIINVLLNNFDLEKAKDFLIFINNLGYFISSYKINNVDYKFISDNQFLKDISENFINKHIKYPITLKIEAIFDEVASDVSEKLYHVTTRTHIEKINKIGLVPKSKSKKSYHPERIYLAKDKDSALEIAAQILNVGYGDFDFSDYILIEVNSKILKEQNNKIYKDPNFAEKGFYVLNNIPKEAIIKITNIEDEF